MGKKKRQGRRAYLNDFQKTAEGTYQYVGQRVSWPGPGQGTAKAMVARLWRWMALGLAASVGAGCISGTGMDGRPFVTLPYMVALVLGACALWSLGRLTGAEQPMRAYVYQATVERLPRLTLAWAVCAGAALVGELVNLFLPDFSGRVEMGGAFLLLEGIALASALLFRQMVSRSKG